VRNLLVAAVLVTGCGDNIPTVAFDDVAAARREAECERLTRCGAFADTATCTAYFRPAFDLDLRAAIGAKRVRYDPADAHACHAALATMSCDQTAAEVRTALADCARVFTGSLAADAECAFDLECASGECDVGICIPNTCCYGRCLAEVEAALDEPCDADRHCIGDAYCGTDDVCHRLATTGMPCTLDSNCDAGLACIGATELQAGACRALPLLGEACPYLRCAEIGAVCSPAQICVPVGAAGAVCTTDAECSEFRSCDPMTSRCADTPSLGMPCGGRCAGEAWCALDGSSIGTCVAPQETAAPCLSNDQCASLFCEEGEFFDTCAERAICF